jgi:hypothetical protein
MRLQNAVRNLSLSLLLCGAFAAPAHAQINFNINMAPPAPQREVVPPVPPGHVWAPGYWGWSGDRHVWVRGRTIVQREGYRWEPDRWDQHGGSFVRTSGHWERDDGHKPKKAKKQKKQKHKDKHD